MVFLFSHFPERYEAMILPMNVYMKTEKLFSNMRHVHDAKTIAKTIATSEKRTIRMTIPKKNIGMI